MFVGEEDVGAVVHERENREGSDERVVLQHGEGVGAYGKMEGVKRNCVEKGRREQDC